MIIKKGISIQLSCEKGIWLKLLVTNYDLSLPGKLEISDSLFNVLENYNYITEHYSDTFTLRILNLSKSPLIKEGIKITGCGFSDSLYGSRVHLSIDDINRRCNYDML